MSKYTKFEELPVWKEAARLYNRVLDLLEEPGVPLTPGFRNQLDRAALSVSNNIAEGFERGTTNELLAFLYIARGSAGEVRSMLCFFERRPALLHVLEDLEPAAPAARIAALAPFAAATTALAPAAAAAVHVLLVVAAALDAALTAAARDRAQQVVADKGLVGADAISLELRLVVGGGVAHQSPTGRIILQADDAGLGRGGARRVR